MPEQLPRDLQAALHALRADTVLVQRLGPEFVAQFLACKQAEWDAYAGQVSRWELQRYADFY